jgi:ketosteroid isomerase-like protein
MATETDEFLAEVLPAQRAADQALHNGDVEPRLALWSHRDPVTVFGAKADADVSGWTDVQPAFRMVASWFSDSQEFEFEVIAAGASGDLAYTVGYERNKVLMEGKPSVYTLRVTHAYRREDGRWRIVHRHADFPPSADTDPPPR